MTLQGANPWKHQDGQLATAEIIKGLAEGKVVASDIGATVLGVTEANVRQYMLELMYAVVAGQLPAAKFAVGLRASGVKLEAQSPDVLVQLLWVVWTHLTYRETGTAENKSNLVDLTKELEKAQLVNKDVLVMNADRFFLEEVGAITKADNLRKREVQVNTRIHYAQRRFNLLREESEGYAKLLDALLRFERVSANALHVKILVKEVKALIGYFDLDPKRVYDVVLEAYEHMPHQEAFLQLTGLFSQDARTQILGFRFVRLAKDDPAGCDALHQVTAQLIKARQVELEALLAHLGPSAEETKAAYVQATKDLEAAVSKIGSISLTQSSTDKDPESRSQKVGLSAAKLELDARPLSNTIFGAALRGNQFFGLAAALLQAGDWDNGSKLLKHLTDLGIDPVAFPAIAKALCKLARELVAPTYKGLYPDGLRGQCILARKDGGRAVSVQPLSEDAVSLLLLLGFGTYHDAQLLTQLARIFRHMTLSNTILFASPATIKEAYERAGMMEQLMVDCLLPAMCMVPALTALANEVWGALNLLDSTDRWRIYTLLKAKTAASPLLQAAGKLASVETKKVLRRLHVTGAQDRREKRRETAPFARLLGKASHTNPLAVCSVLIGQAEAYSVMAQPIVEALTYFSELSFDVMSFLIIERLAASGRPKIKEDGINISDWLQALCVFTGRACLACDKIDVSSICQYVADTLKQAESYDLLVLRSIVEDMTGISLVSDVSGEQVEALAGGPLLQQLVLNQERNARQVTPKMLARASQRLASALQQGMPQEQLALPLLVLLGQQRRYIAVQTQTGPLKLIAELYDKAQESLYLYVEFLSSALSSDAYSSMLPSITELVSKYQLDIEVALQAHRPVLRELVPPHPVHDASLPNGHMDMEDGEAEEGELEEGEAAEEPKDVAMPDAHPEGEAAALTAAVTGNGAAVEHPTAEDTKGWEEAVMDVRSALPETVWESISPEFYMAFWSLRYEDIFVPSDRYAREQHSLKDQIRGKEEEVISMERLSDELRRQEAQTRQYGGFPGMGGYPGGGGYAGGGGYRGGGRDNEPEVSLEDLLENVEVMKQNIRDMKEVLKHLPGELAAQEQHVREMDEVLQARKGLWPNERSIMVRAYIQHCILPRVTYSPADAAFCAVFMQRLIDFKMPWFPAFIYLDAVMKQLIYLLPTCTDREALNLAIFYHETFIIMERWRAGLYITNQRLPGIHFEGALGADSKLLTSVVMLELPAPGPSLEFSHYKRLCLKWQQTVVAALRIALSSKEYVQTRNALLFLSYNSKAVLEQGKLAENVTVGHLRDHLRTSLQVYPMVQRYASDLKQAALAVCDQADREDLRTMANMYSNNLDGEMKRAGRMVSEEVYSGQPPKRPPSAGARTDASAGKAVGTSAAPKAVKQAEEKPKTAPAKAVGDQRKEQQDTDIEAGEVDVKKGNLLRPDAPVFKPGKEDTSASAAAAATSSKRKEAEQAPSTQAKEQERRRASDKGERASKRQRTSDIEAGELEAALPAASKPPAAAEPQQRPASDERRSRPAEPERHGSLRRQADGPAGSRADRKALEREADKLARREERFAEKAPSASARAKAAEPGEVPEANGRSRRPSEAGGRKEPSSASLPAPKAEVSRPSREHRPKDRDTAAPKERDSGNADRTRHAAGQKEEAPGQLAGQKEPAQNGKATGGKQVERDAEQKAKAAVRSSQKAAAPADEQVHKSAAQPEDRAGKPAVELDSLRERALSSRRPAAKQEELADPAGDRKETARSAARPGSRKVIEYKQSEKGAPEFTAAEGAAEAPEPAKEVVPRVPKPAAAERTSSAPKAHGDNSPETPRRDSARLRLEKPKAEVDLSKGRKAAVFSRLGFPIKQEESSPHRRAPTTVAPAHAAGDAHVETGQAPSTAVESPDADDTKAKKDKKIKKEKKDKKKRKEREVAEGDNEDDDLTSVRSGKTGKKDKKDRKGKKARAET